MNSKRDGEACVPPLPKFGEFWDLQLEPGQWTPVYMSGVKAGTVTYLVWSVSESLVNLVKNVPVASLALSPFRTHTRYDYSFDYFLMDLDLHLPFASLHEDVKKAFARLPDTRSELVQFFEGRLPWAIKRLIHGKGYQESGQGDLHGLVEMLGKLFVRTIDRILDSYVGAGAVTGSAVQGVWPAIMMMVSAVSDAHSYMHINPLQLLYDIHRRNSDLEHEYSVTHQITVEFERVGIMKRWKRAYETPGMPFKHLILIPAIDMCRLVGYEDKEQYYRETLSALHRRWQVTTLEDYRDISYAELLEISRNVRFFIDNLQYGYNDGLVDLQASILHSIRLLIASGIESEQLKGLSFLTHIMDLDFTNGRDWTLPEITQIAMDDDMVKSALLTVVTPEGTKTVRKLLHYMIAEEKLDLTRVNPLPDMKLFLRQSIVVSMMEHRMWRQLEYLVESGYTLQSLSVADEGLLSITESGLRFSTPAPLLLAIVNSPAEIRPSGWEFLVRNYEEPMQLALLRTLQPNEERVIFRLSTSPEWDPSAEVKKLLVYYSIYRLRLFLLSLIERSLTPLSLLPYDLQFFTLTNFLT